MDLAFLVSLLEKGFLIYLKQNTKKKIQEEFFKEIYSRVDRKEKIKEENIVDQKSIEMIDEFEVTLKEQYFPDIDKAENENEVFAIYRNFVKAKDEKILELKTIYKKIYGKFM